MKAVILFALLAVACANEVAFKNGEEQVPGNKVRVGPHACRESFVPE